MSGLQVTPQDLKDASTTLSTGAGDIESQLATLKSQLNTIHTSWTGAAKGEFDRLWEEWDRNAMALKDNLMDISSLLGTAGDNYQEAEDRNRASFGS